MHTQGTVGFSGFALSGFACVRMRRNAASVLAGVQRGRDLVARHIHMTQFTTSISVLTHDHQNGMANATGGLVSRMWCEWGEKAATVGEPRRGASVCVWRSG